MNPSRIRRILVPLDPSVYTESAIKTACHIAQSHGAEVTGIAVFNPPDLNNWSGPLPLGVFNLPQEAQEEIVEEAHQKMNALFEKFNTTCQEYGVKYRDAQYKGVPAERILEASMFYDLLVLGKQCYYKDISGALAQDSLTKILRQSITPILGVPKEALTEIKKALVLFDGSLPSARTLQEFAYFAQGMDIHTRILMAHPDADEARYFLEQAESYLHAHDIENIQLQHSKAPIREALEESDNLPASDLVSAGIHSHATGLKSFFVGSLMKYLLEEKEKAIFLSH